MIYIFRRARSSAAQPSLLAPKLARYQRFKTMSSPAKRRLNHGAYTVALICPLEVEMSAARYMLDEEHERLPKDKHDTNSYILGRLSGHNVVIVSLPEGSQGNVSAATVAIHLAGTFPAIELRLLVGIGGGVPG